jgi:hypothetical protein
MNIECLAKEVYEDLGGAIYAVKSDGDLTVYFECDDWAKAHTTRKFKITCTSVKESTISQSSVGSIEFTEADPVLWKHNEDHGYLYYLSETENRYELLGRVWEVHERIFNGLRPLSEYLNVFNSENRFWFCKDSYGQLANGPLLLLKAYEAALAGKIRTKIVSSYKPEGGYRVLFFDSSFVVCKSVVVEELCGN